MHVPLNKDKTYLINSYLLKKMKPTSFLINASRGGVVDEDSLYELLQRNKIAGAAIDVSEEPYNGPLLNLDNVILTSLGFLCSRRKTSNGD